VLRRLLVPELGAATLAGWAWRHRGTLVRAGDLALRSPSLVRDGRTRELATEARAVLALDAPMAKTTSVRISGVDAGTVTVHGDPGPRAVTAVRDALREVPGVSDVRSDGSTLPTAASVLEAAPTRT
jgi:hypothetical protein